MPGAFCYPTGNESSLGYLGPRSELQYLRGLCESLARSHCLCLVTLCYVATHWFWPSDLWSVAPTGSRALTFSVIAISWLIRLVLILIRTAMVKLTSSTLGRCKDPDSSVTFLFVCVCVCNSREWKMPSTRWSGRSDSISWGSWTLLMRAVRTVWAVAVWYRDGGETMIWLAKQFYEVKLKLLQWLPSSTTNHIASV